MDAVDVELLRVAGFQLLDFLLGHAPERKSIRYEYEEAFGRIQSVAGIDQLLSILLTWSDALPPEAILDLDRQLSVKNCATLTWLRARSAKSLEGVLKRGLVETRDEYRVVDWFTRSIGPAGPTPAERHQALQLMDKYSERDQESAYTSPQSLAWRAAARELKMRFIAPYKLGSGESYWCCGLLPDFGGEKGTVILGRYAPEEADAMAASAGFYTSGLNPLYYDFYDRELFESTLDDWGWFGKPSEAPDWFKGGLRTHGGP